MTQNGENQSFRGELPFGVSFTLTVKFSTCFVFTQGYVVCPSEKRFLLLFTFLKKNTKKKVMVFFSSCMSVKYHSELLNYIDLPVMSIHVSYFNQSTNQSINQSINQPINQPITLRCLNQSVQRCFYLAQEVKN